MEEGTTVILHVAVLPPSFVLTVIVAVPAFTAVTIPPLTDATVASEVDHSIVLSVALSGRTVAERVSLSPSVRVRDDGEMLTLETEIVVGAGGVGVGSGPSGLSSSHENNSAANARKERNRFIINSSLYKVNFFQKRNNDQAAKSDSLSIQAGLFVKQLSHLNATHPGEVIKDEFAS